MAKLNLQRPINDDPAFCLFGPLRLRDLCVISFSTQRAQSRGGPQRKRRRQSSSTRRRLVSWLALAWLFSGSLALGQVSFEEPPIDYLKAAPQDAVTKLQTRLDAGEVQLEFDPRRGYLESVLENLQVPISSQALVFSRTSFQLQRISPRTPRAIYFNDDVYVGWVQRGDVMEVSAADPALGANFYTLNQSPSAHPKFERQTYDCLQCHGSTLTQHIPGHVVRSVFAGSDGHPILKAGTFLTDHASPLRERWGGWYVTGVHGTQRHLGNQWVRESEAPDGVNLDVGANVTELDDLFPTKPYLTPHSDLVALMVLEHQVGMHNRLTRASFLTRLALRDQQVMNEMLNQPADYRSESTIRRIRSAGEPVVQYMLFAGEAALTEPVSGTSGFADEFARRGPHDEQGRSLRELDLKSRLFRYPCSYLIYSDSFDSLPEPVREYILQRLWQVLSGQDTSKDFAHLSTEDRQAIREILRDTKPTLPEQWREPRKSAEERG